MADLLHILINIEVLPPSPRVNALGVCVTLRTDRKNKAHFFLRVTCTPWCRVYGQLCNLHLDNHPGLHGREYWAYLRHEWPKVVQSPCRFSAHLIATLERFNRRYRARATALCRPDYNPGQRALRPYAAPGMGPGAAHSLACRSASAQCQPAVPPHQQR
jgi:hypothetical protein